MLPLDQDLRSAPLSIHVGEAPPREDELLHGGLQGRFSPVSEPHVEHHAESLAGEFLQRPGMRLSAALPTPAGLGLGVDGADLLAASDAV